MDQITPIEILKAIPLWGYLVHAALIPLYLTIGAVKHEYAHAIAAALQGFRIIRVRVLPYRSPEGWQLGKAEWHTFGLYESAHTYLAPYYADAVLFGVGLVTLNSFGIKWEAIPHVFLTTLIVTTLLPAVDFVYNAGKWLLLDTGDFAEIARKVGV